MGVRLKGEDKLMDGTGSVRKKISSVRISGLPNLVADRIAIAIYQLVDKPIIRSRVPPIQNPIFSTAKRFTNGFVVVLDMKKIN